MTTEIKIVEEAKKPRSMHPKKFAMWLFIVTVCMLFAAWTSAYLVKRAEAGWAEIIIPDQFWINTVIIIASSGTMAWAQHSARKDNLEKVKLAISITTVLGVAFLIGQWIAWGKLVELNEHFSGGNVSHSFLYVLTGIHGLHILGGVIFLIIVLISTYRFQVHSKNMTRIELCSTFWHFLDVLWLYLFAFLMINK
ncbi:MAG TPA: cytochrome c oxidase subunit 3 [Cyclobacteriaceae bacterium]|jgi:cytochrome c oxidase subunit 3|nr:cytochrome c oxidase subunit 3 [Cyclobacteriaceae bacterium]